jgi:nicotinamide riboside kinase
MHIHFIGAQITGKSYMVKAIGKRWCCETRAETAREELIRMGVDLDILRKDLDLMNEYQWNIFYNQRKKEFEAPEWCVFDRCALDNVAYAAEYAEMVADLVDSEDFKNYLKYIRKATLFFLRPQKSFLSKADDGTRKNLSWDSVMRIDGMIKFILEVYRVPYHLISTPSMQERVRKVENVVGSLEEVREKVKKSREV